MPGVESRLQQGCARVKAAKLVVMSHLGKDMTTEGSFPPPTPCQRQAVAGATCSWDAFSELEDEWALTGQQEHALRPCSDKRVGRVARRSQATKLVACSGTWQQASWAHIVCLAHTLPARPMAKGSTLVGQA